MDALLYMCKNCIHYFKIFHLAQFIFHLHSKHLLLYPLGEKIGPIERKPRRLYYGYFTAYAIVLLDPFSPRAHTGQMNFSRRLSAKN